MNIEKKIQDEKKILEKTILIYCRKNHKVKDGLCSKCQDLKDYSFKRTDLCPFMETKTFCNNCTVHCYKPEMREEIRKVMAFSGPRLIFSNPILTLKHLIFAIKKKRQESK